MLKAKKPELIKKRLKMLIYGVAGVGKTTAAIQFPNSYLIDTERGAENDQYVTMLSEKNSSILQTSSFDEIMCEVKALLTEKHDFKTLIIDSLTPVYNEIVDKFSKKVGDDYGRNFKEAAKLMKFFSNMLLRLDMNVIITSHSKNEYGQNLSVIGQTFDAYKKLDYIFDLVLEIKKHAKKRIAVVKKSRISEFEELQEFEFSYDAIADRYGRDIIEAKSKEIEIVDSSLIDKFYILCKKLNVCDDKIEEWLEKECVEKIEHFSKQSMIKLIDYLEKKVKKNR